MSRDEVQQFFERYRDAFNALDGDAVAELWHAAGSGITDMGADGQARVTWWPQSGPMRANHQALCELYRHNGFARTEFSLHQHHALGAEHAFALLQWRLLRHDGSLLQQFQTAYQVLRTLQGPRVLLAVAFEENTQRLKRTVAAASPA